MTEANKSTKVLILSPHCDDVPLSLGGSLANELIGNDITVIVVFSKSAYTLEERGNANVEITSRIRKNEEKLAARKLGYKVQFLDFEEPLVRPGIKRFEEICNPSNIPVKDAVWPDVRNKIFQVLSHFEGILITPLGIGNHIDHRIVFTAVREFINEHHEQNQLYPAFYEDLPYFTDRKKIRTGIQSILTSINSDFQEYFFRSSGIDQKLDVLKAYVSQINEHHLNIIYEYWQKYKGEYIWVSKRTREAFDII